MTDVKQKYPRLYEACPHQWARNKGTVLRVRALDDLIRAHSVVIKAGDCGWANPIGYFGDDFQNSPQEKPIGEGCAGHYVYAEISDSEFNPRREKYVIVKSSQVREA